MEIKKALRVRRALIYENRKIRASLKTAFLQANQADLPEHFGKVSSRRMRIAQFCFISW